MNIEATLPEVGARVMKEQPAVRSDVQRIVQIWEDLLGRYGGPMLFGKFSIADAFFAPVVARFSTYGVPLTKPAADYVRSVTELPGVAAWVADALQEHDFLPFEEQYRTAPAR
jgi:glutathione S-transferase